MQFTTIFTALTMVASAVFATPFKVHHSRAALDVFRPDITFPVGGETFTVGDIITILWKCVMLLTFLFTWY